MMRAILLAGFLLPSSSIAQPPELPNPNLRKETPAGPLTNEELIRQLIVGLSDPDSEVRQHLGVALAKIGTPAIQPLAEALSNSNRERRAGAAYALGQMRPAPKEALPQLLEALKDKEEIVRRQVAYAISRIVDKKGADSLEIPLAQPAIPITRRGDQ